MQNDLSRAGAPSAAENMVSAKRRLRAQGRAARAALDQAQRAGASAAIGARLRALFEAAPCAVVFVYLATQDEVSVDDFIAWLLEQGVSVWAPRGDDFAPLESLDAVRMGRWGLREPEQPLPAGPVIEIAEHPAAPSMILVPGLLFDQSGGRIGFGGGWYDRALARFPQAQRLGIAFDQQIVDNVPREAHDVMMDAVVTPSGVRGEGVNG